MTYLGYQPVLNCCISPNNQHNGIWYLCKEHGWRLVLVMGRTNEGYPINVTIEKESELECTEKAIKLGLTSL